MKPDPVLLERLSVSRFMPRQSRPSVGTGERPSNVHGVGLEFGGHRPYREGDDLRRLDPRVRARLGQDFVRVYAEDRQLPITIVLDTSQSMLEGGAEKRELAVSITQLLAFIGMAGGDLVRVVTVSAEEKRWSPRWQSLAKSEEMFAWIAEAEAEGMVPFGTELAAIADQIPPASLLLVVSDWWTNNLENVVLATAKHGHQVVALHIEAPEESDPSLIGEGLVHFVDSENNEVVDIVVDDLTIEAYRAAHAERIEWLRSQFVAVGGQYVRVVSNAASPSELFLAILRSNGVIS
ncbi:DUF58 domain-containing protein [Devosia sp. WQ 349]|uniref:DUF58 domain-containing protein n=1 Tax=Devosia sp. WQ 349K1 TaxID=2800329 RepID=UPI0019068450|nr:DUF58 domain-containing protein [Devosia sp. WQ 349K1]